MHAPTTGHVQEVPLDPSMLTTASSHRRCSNLHDTSSLEWGAFHDSISADLRSIRVFTVVGLVMILVGSTMLGVGLSVGADTWALWRLGLAGFVLGLALTLTSYWALHRRARMMAIQQQLAAAAARGALHLDAGDSLTFRDENNRISVIYGTEDVWMKPPVYDPPPSYEEIMRIKQTPPGPEVPSSSTASTAAGSSSTLEDPPPKPPTA